ncbi:MAG: nuclear transport factor 2 family protein [Alphaproteobacteria bacterium]|nr:nuclear transport factor 2 family protein [Alphaproteobacteria bacterium]
MDTLARYCRGIDRCEVETLKSVYWPDGVDDHGTFVGLGHDFAEAVTPRLLDMKQTMHAIANVTIELMGDWARVETYVIAYHLIPSESGDQEMIVGGRYLDHFEKRSGAWRIKHRLYVMDWNQNGPATAIWDRGLFAQLKTRGARGADDPWETAPHLRDPS